MDRRGMGQEEGGDDADDDVDDGDDAEHRRDDIDGH